MKEHKVHCRTGSLENYLRKRDDILTALENAGVDNWSGYDDVLIELYSDNEHSYAYD